MTEEVVVDVTNCARCGNDHEGLSFARFIRPPDHLLAGVTHWASCPNTGEPILLQVIEETRFS